MHVFKWTGEEEADVRRSPRKEEQVESLHAEARPVCPLLAQVPSSDAVTVPGFGGS